jgi:pyruvate formate lyase activating enzyme
MKIGGMQKLSLVDFPGKLSSIIWTIGCNFRCPFCYNSDLVFEKAQEMPEQEVLDYLKKRKEMLDAVVITGGEPLLQEDIFDFLKKIRGMDYKIKIDSNGSMPETLEQLIDERLVDYVALDIKAPPEKYEKLIGIHFDPKKIEQSINLLRENESRGNIDYEFRTTFVPKLLTKQDIFDIAKWISGSKRYYLQQFQVKHPLLSPAMEKVEPYKTEFLQEVITEIKPNFKVCELRNI